MDHLTVHSPLSRKTINWAGGTSTEIFIVPSDGDFATRKFDFRISTATVEAEESDFTFFEGITRHLMILKGTLELTHIDRYTKVLQPYDQDTFSGEWPTKSKGKVVDFNLMLKNGYTGKLECKKMEQGEALSLNPQTDYHFIYIAEGVVSMDGRQLNPGDLLQLDQAITLTSDTHAVLISISVTAP